MKKLKIDFVSDVVCPWCAVGLSSLQQALGQLEGEVQVDLHFQPFELNPQMAPEGEDVTEHLAKKYGSTPEQAAAAREAIRQRGAAVGFTFNLEQRSRIYNTFDAHRLLHWAEELDAAAQPQSSLQLALKQALLTAYFTQGRNPSDRAVLVDVAMSVGLDANEARAVLESDRYANEVRAQERFYTGAGIHSVPSVIINDKHLISGGQPPEVFAQALRQIAHA